MSKTNAQDYNLTGKINYIGPRQWAYVIMYDLRLSQTQGLVQDLH